MGQIIKNDWGYVYMSNNGIPYDIGECGAEFNIIIDGALDYEEKYDGLIGFKCHLVDYVYGDIEDKDTLKWIDRRIKQYENHERILRLDDYECYVGLREEHHQTYKRITENEMKGLV